jgi:hypothetical protein
MLPTNKEKTKMASLQLKEKKKILLGKKNSN